MHAQTRKYSTVIFNSCNSCYTYDSRIMIFDTRDLHLATATNKLVGPKLWGKLGDGDSSRKGKG
jgi:hypothetical protein